MRPSLLTWLCTSLSAAFVSVWWSFLALLPNLVLQALLAPFLRLPILAVWSFSRSLTTFSLKLAGSRSATLNLATALLSAQGRHHCTWRLRCCLLSVGHQKSGPSLRVIVWVICASHGTCGVAAVFLHDLDLFLKLRHVEEFLGCPHFIWDISPCKTRDANFGLFT